jgi:hypothetical protein
LPRLIHDEDIGYQGVFTMAWEKHSKKISELKKSNTEIDMKVSQRLEEMVTAIVDKDTAVSLEFLKEHLHLQHDNEDAIKELRFHLRLMGDVRYAIIGNDADQSIYVYFEKEKTEEEPASED